MATSDRQSLLAHRRAKELVRLLLKWFSNNARNLPWRRTRDPYAIWVSEIMLQQTQVKTVLPFWTRWMRELPTIEAVANATTEKIYKLWEGLGYYSRVRNLQKAARIILERHGGKFPAKFDDILALPGIGRYTAGALCSIAFNQPAPVLDGNVIRVLTRVFGIKGNPGALRVNRLLWRLAEHLVQNSKRPSHFNQSLMELGAVVCSPRTPKCPLCPVIKYCVAFKENRVNQLPNLGKRPQATARNFVAFVIEQDGRFLVRQRPKNGVNANLWEFPNVEINGGTANLRRIFKSAFGFLPPAFQRLPAIKHSITRYRITMNAYHVSLSERPSTTDGVWLSSSEFDSVALTAAHKKLASFTTNRILKG